ncbi:hypothetical protein [Serratia liquefaciens]|uniref:Ead/Ea22-like family protein n=1 Tax=Serratia liquefaciens TaxID=614 RepID=A0A515CRG5_SERLI|nr:hypothetical protein [Serratia liquefaciens]QDL30747.1 hypothetical protein EGO53_02605 [Serratia liquefaciens]
MKNNLENQDIKTDKPLAMSYEALKAERDALERQLLMSEAKCKGYFSDAAAALVRCDALAVENAALKKSLIAISLAEPIDGETIVCDFDTLVSIAAGALTTPATDAALAAIEARGAVAAIENLISRKERALAEMHPDTHAYGATQATVRNQIYDLELFAAELREAK